MRMATLCQVKSIQNTYARAVQKIFTIYKYTNIHNGKVYIGQTSKSLEDRAQANGSNYRECRRFYNAIEKYGWSSFEAEVLEVVDSQDEANDRESYYISFFNSTDDLVGYNISHGGGSKVMSDETRQIISRKAKERYRDKTANPMYGKKHSKSALRKQSEKKLGDKNPMYGRKWTETQRAKCGTKGKKLNLSDEHREELRRRMKEIASTIRPRAVRCVEDDAIFPSITDAANTYGVSVSTLCGHLRGSQKSCRGKHFVYELN